MFGEGQVWVRVVGVQFRQVSKRRTFQSDFKLSEQKTLVKRVIGLKQQSSIRSWCLSNCQTLMKKSLFDAIWKNMSYQVRSEGPQNFKFFFKRVVGYELKRTVRRYVVLSADSRLRTEAYSSSACCVVCGQRP